jgi:hypothetical protein
MLKAPSSVTAVVSSLSVREKVREYQSEGTDGTAPMVGKMVEWEG